MSVLALAVALTGTAYASGVLPKNSVGTAQLKNNAVTGPKLKPHSLFASDFASGELPEGVKGWVTVEPDGTIYTHGGSLASPTITKKGTGLYCVSGAGWVSQGGPYSVQAIGADGAAGQAVINPYFWGSACNPVGNNVGVQVSSGTGTPADGYFTLVLFG